MHTRSRKPNRTPKSSTKSKSCSKHYSAVRRRQRHTPNSTLDFQKETLPTSPLIILRGTVKGQTVDILKDDGCNTNVMSSSFIKKHGHLLTLKKDNLSITHSENKTTETATQLVLDAEVRIGAHQYRSNFAVVNCRYDILLGMPWHKSENPSVDYAGKKVRVNGLELPRRPSPEKLEAGITNLSIKKFRSVIRKHGAKEDFQLYHVVPILRKREKGKAVLNNV